MSVVNRDHVLLNVFNNYLYFFLFSDFISEEKYRLNIFKFFRHYELKQISSHKKKFSRIR